MSDLISHVIKESGFEYIKEVPNSWSIVPAQYLFSEVREKNRDNSHDNAFSFKYGEIVPKTVIGDEDEKLDETYSVYTVVEPNTIILNGLNLNYDFVTQRVAVVREKGIITSAYLAVYPDPGRTRADFACYLFKAFDAQRVFHNMGTGLRKTLKFADFKKCPVLVPTLEEQESIVSHLSGNLSRVDSMIADAKVNIGDYKLLKQSIITQAVTKGLDPNIPMKDCGIEWVGGIPALWSKNSLGNIAYIRARLGWKGLKADEYVDSGYMLLSAFNIVESRIDYTSLNYIDQFRYDESPEIKLAESDILLVKDGAGIGKCAMVQALPLEATANGSLAVITFGKEFDSRYFFYYFQSHIFQKYIDRLRAGMGVPHLFQSNLRKICVPVPAYQEQVEISDYLDSQCSSVDSIISEQQSLVDDLVAAKKSLIYECVTGKRKVG